MKQSELLCKTVKNIPKDEVSLNAQFLIKAGFVYKVMAGVYAYLPLGLRVLNKVSNIIRDEMNAVGGQELKMTTLQDKEIWKKTGRWSDEVVDNWFKTSLKKGGELGLGFTHEEAVTELMKGQINSYKDLPVYAYQIQTKFRNEIRAKAGLIRGREFLMKDLYSFSRNKEEHEKFYEKMKEAYMKVFSRLGMKDKTYITISSGGSFSKYSYEFQALSEAGEDKIYIIDKEKRIAINKDDFNDEVLADFDLDVKKEDLEIEKSIEIGDIYSLGDKYSKALELFYRNDSGEMIPVFMGSYGMSPSRLMGAVVELNHDERGIIWPEEVAPFKVHLISITNSKDDESYKKAKELYEELTNKGIEILWDNRLGVRPGEKFAEADLIGCSYRLVVSKKTLEENKLELKKRSEDQIRMIDRSELVDLL